MSEEPLAHHPLGDGINIDAGHEVWERVVPFADGKAMAHAIGLNPAHDTVSVSIVQFRQLLKDAGFEFRGYGDGTFQSWTEKEYREEQGDAQ